MGRVSSIMMPLGTPQPTFSLPDAHGRMDHSEACRGENGMLVYEEITATVTWHRKRIDDDLNSVDEGSEVVFQGAEAPLRLELEHFLECVWTRQRPISDGRNGLAVVTVLERIMMF